MPPLNWWQRITRPEAERVAPADGWKLGRDYVLDVEPDSKEVVRRYRSEPDALRRATLTMDPQVNAPPPVRGLLEPPPEDRAKLRQALIRKRNNNR